MMTILNAIKFKFFTYTSCMLLLLLPHNLLFNFIIIYQVSNNRISADIVFIYKYWKD